MKRLNRFIKEYRLFVFALLSALAGLAFQLAGYHMLTYWLLSAVSILEVCPLLWNMWKDFRAGSYGIDILAATAIIAAVALDQYWAAIIIVLMLTGGESLEKYASHRANSELQNLLKEAPLNAHVIRKGKTYDVKVNEIKVGEKLLIKQGEVVPADAVITEGTASFDESKLTGESLPLTKNVKDRIMSGSINLDGTISAKVIASAEDSQYQQIIKLVRGAAASKAPFVRLAARYSLPFTFASFAIAITVWVLSGQAIRFLEVIVVATPCPLLLAVPVAIISGMSRATRYGIIIKTGAAIEQLSDAQTIAFDKTGTFTKGKPEVDSITTFGTYSQSEILGLAASLEQNSNHVLGQAIVQNAQSKQIKLTKAKHAKEFSGLGLQATIKGRSVLVGRFSLLESNDISIPPSYNQKKIDQTSVYVAIDGKLAGIISLKDALRPESKSTLRLLRKLGLKRTMMVTGDNEQTAKLIAKKLGIDHIHANMLPADKLHIMDEVSRRPLVFVGDGINDAPALTASDVGIAIGAKESTAASDSADIVILTNNIGRLATAYEISKRTFRIALQSILVGISISFILMIVYATGKFSPISGAIVQEIVDVVVILNALRAHSGKVTELIATSEDQ